MCVGVVGVVCPGFPFLKVGNYAEDLVCPAPPGVTVDAQEEELEDEHLEQEPPAKRLRGVGNVEQKDTPEEPARSEAALSTSTGFSTLTNPLLLIAVVQTGI